MLQRVSSDCLQRAKQVSINTFADMQCKISLVSQLCVDMKVDGDFGRLGFNPASLSNKIQILEALQSRHFELVLLIFRKLSGSLLSLENTVGNGESMEKRQNV